MTVACRLVRYIGGLACLLGPVAASAENVQFGLPVACDPGRTCFIQNYVDADPSPAARDYQCGSLTNDGHNGTDFRLPSMTALRQGVDVLAAADGRVLRVRDDVADTGLKANGRDAVKGMECGNGAVVAHADGWETQYCHLARGSLQVRPGQSVKAGQPLGRVGLSGLTEYPHLHFTIRREGKIVDPFAHGAGAGRCGSGGTMLWDPALRDRLAYQERTILNTGFASGAVTMQSVEEGEAGRVAPDAEASALVAFVRAIGLREGDAQSLSLRAPSGKEIAAHRLAPLESNKAQTLLFAGARRPPGGWEQGTYQATYAVMHDGKTVLQRDLQFDLR